MDNRERINDDEETLRMAFDSQLANLWTSLPAIVTAVDFQKMTVSAQPALKGSILQPNGEYVSTNLPLLVDVPIMYQGGGGYIITLPVAIGDECLVVFADRCIDAWWQSGGVQEQLEFRMHDLSDGFALVGVRSQPKVVPNISSSNVQIRSDDGSVFVEIDKTGKVNITAPTSVTVTTPTATLTGDVHINGNLVTDGTITAPTVIGTANVIFGGISGTGHIHTGVQSGTSTTGAPQ